MADLRYDLLIASPVDRVFQAMATPDGLNAWWTLSAEGHAIGGSTWKLGFGPDHNWEAVVTTAMAGLELEWKLTQADEDWMGTRVGFRLSRTGTRTRVEFHHAGWREENRHFRSSSFCWALYLRLLKRYVEAGERVAYDRRLDA